MLLAEMTEFADRRHQRARRHAADEAIAFDQQRPCAVAGRRHGSDQPGGAAATDDDVIAATEGHLAAWYADRRILFEYRGHTSSTGQFGWLKDRKSKRLNSSHSCP